MSDFTDTARPASWIPATSAVEGHKAGHTGTRPGNRIPSEKELNLGELGEGGQELRDCD